MQKKKKLDLPQAIVLAVVLGAIIIAAGLVLTFGPEDSRAHVAEWIAGGIAICGAVFASMRSKGLFLDSDESAEDLRGLIQRHHALGVMDGIAPGENCPVCVPGVTNSKGDR